MTYPLRIVRRTGALCAFALFASCLFAAEAAKQNFNLPAGDAEKTLREFTRQAKAQLVFDSEKVAGIKTAAVKGEATPGEALDRMFAGTGLVAEQDKTSGAFTVRRETPAEAKNGSSRPGSDRTAGDKVEGTIKLDTFEVMGTKLLNMDKPRSRDDAQPYVVFSRETISSSGAINLEDFLKQRLTMNTVGQTPSQAAFTTQGNTSAINLRGLGTNQTLVLIDGHRAAGPTVPNQGTPGQTNINGIPLAAVERIEVLPTTASGIYGGSATGGVVNIILRRDYVGAELKITYDNTFDSDTAIRRVDFASGFTLQDGKTNVLLAASWADSNYLFLQDRDFVPRGRALIIANLGGDPANLQSTTTAPLGSTVNIRRVNGSPLFGPGTSNITYLPVGYTGGLAPLLTNAGKYNLGLAPTAQQYAGAGSGGKQSLGNFPETESASATIRRQFNPRIQAFLELAASNTRSESWNSVQTPSFTIAANAPNNPFGQAIQVAVPVAISDTLTYIATQDRRIVAGVLFKLPWEWQGEVDYTWNRLRYNSRTAGSLSSAVTTAVSNGSLNVLRDPALIDFSPYLPAFSPYVPPVHSLLTNATLRLSGPIATLPAGAVNLSALFEHRKEGIDDFYLYSVTSVSLSPNRTQTSDAVYLETNLPLLAGRTADRPKLELQLAGRWDDYSLKTANAISTNVAPFTLPLASIVRVSQRQTSTNPTVGLRYQPVPSVAFRASYGTGFVPPTLNQLTTTSSTATSNSVDPRRGNAPVTSFAFLSGGNPNLRPELSESWSGGVIFTPAAVSTLRVSLDYTRITKRDNISTLGVQQLIDNEAIFPGRITRGANLPTDQPGWAGPITALDLTSVNISRAFVEAYDVAVDYGVKTAAAGSFDISAAATWQPHFRTQLISSVPEVENAGINGSSSIPLKFKANTSVSWTYGRWTVGWLTRYYDSLLVANPTLSTSTTTYQRQGAQYIPRQFYHDLYAKFRFGNGAGSMLRWLRNTEVQCGVRNVFNKQPPFDVTRSVTLYNELGDPRLASYYLSVKQVF